MFKRNLERFVSAAEWFAVFRQRPWFRWWSAAALIGFVLVLLLTDRSELRGSAWGYLAATLLVVGLPWIVTVLVDALITTVVILLSGTFVIRLILRLGPRGGSTTNEKIPAWPE